MPKASKILESPDLLRQAILEGLPATGVMIFDHGLTVVFAEGQAYRTHGYEPSDMIGRQLADLAPPGSFAELAPRYQAALAGETIEFEMASSDESLWYHIHAGPLTEDGDIVGGIVISRDVTDRRRSDEERKVVEDELKRVASEDSLTGLANRRQLELELEAQLERCRRYGERAALMMLDLDEFKRANDDHGHAAGDEILRTVASDLRARLRRNDVIARIGGDEFAILMVGGETSSAAKLAQDLMDHFDARKIEFGRSSLGCRASVGAAVFTGRESDIDEVMLRADRAMYAIKQIREASA